MSFPIDKREITTLSQYFLLHFGRFCAPITVVPDYHYVKNSITYSCKQLFYEVLHLSYWEASNTQLYKIIYNTGSCYKKCL